jgi:4-fold beta flower protein
MGVEFSLMTDYIYNSRGQAVGFLRGRYIHSMDGSAIGQINGTHVHKLSGPYVGELYKDMVVDQHRGNYGNIGNPGDPGNPGSPGNPGNRGAVNYGYPDVFDELLKDD